MKTSTSEEDHTPFSKRQLRQPFYFNLAAISQKCHGCPLITALNVLASQRGQDH